MKWAPKFLRSNGQPQPPPRRPLPLLRLRVGPSLSAAAHRHILAAAARLPILVGRPISIAALPHLTAHRGKLLSGSRHLGTPVHAATFIRRREIILETQLTRKPGLLRLITVHEIFHFVWARLGTPARRSNALLLKAEIAARARGELGESSSVKKTPECTPDYVCESFCDTAAWLYAGVRRSPDFTLAARWRNFRRTWFEHTFGAKMK